MRSLLLLVIALGACDLQPPPKGKPKPTANSGSNETPPPPPDVPADAAVPSTPDAMETSAACNDIGVKIATQMLTEATDPAQKSMLTQERDRIVRRVAEACTRDNWPPAARDCFLKATTSQQMQECGKDLAAPHED